MSNLVVPPPSRALASDALTVEDRVGRIREIDREASAAHAFVYDLGRRRQTRFGALDRHISSTERIPVGLRPHVVVRQSNDGFERSIVRPAAGTDACFIMGHVSRAGAGL